MLDARDLANYDDSEENHQAPFDFGEEWPDWFARRKRPLEQAVARIREEQPRLILEVVVQTLDFANGIAYHSNAFASADAVVRDAANLGFEVATAWLREQEVPDIYQGHLDRLKAGLEDMVEAVTQSPVEDSSR